MKKTLRYLLVVLLSSLFLPAIGHAGNQAISAGYGYGVLNEHKSTGRIEGGKNYDFFQLTYLYESPYREKTSFLFEPFAAFINRPNSGLDVGMDVLFRYYPFIERRGGLFLDIGAGAAYTSVAFHEQRTHLLGILIGGIGFRYNNFFVTDRLIPSCNQKRTEAATRSRRWRTS